MTHYIAMAGLHGCLPQACEAFDTRTGAVEYLVSLHELEHFTGIRAELKQTGYAELVLHRHGNEYCSVETCNCEDPASHSDSGGF